MYNYPKLTVLDSNNFIISNISDVEVIENEIWKDVIGYEGLYQISNMGRVKSIKDTILRNGNLKYVVTIKKERLRKPQMDKNGYLFVTLSKNNIIKNEPIAKLVAAAFLNHTNNSLYLVIDHIDSNRTNNKLENLQIISQRENIAKRQIIKTSKYVGVSFNKKQNKWKAYIKSKGILTHLGWFNDEESAYLKRQEYLKLNNL